MYYMLARYDAMKPNSCTVLSHPSSAAGYPNGHVPKQIYRRSLPYPFYIERQQ